MSALVSRRRQTTVLTVGLTLLTAVLVVHLGSGRSQLPVAEVLTVFADAADPLARHIVVEVRAPRAVTGGLVGALLGVAGSLLQALTRNELADPGLLGVTPAAVLAVVVALVATGGAVATTTLPAVAFLGALVGGLVVYRLGWRGGADPLRFVLTGIILGAVLSAMTTILLLRSGDSMGAVFRWVIGSLHARTWSEAQLVLIAGLALVPFIVLARRPADLLQLGDEVARGRGLAVEWARAGVFAVAAAATAAAVAVSGALAFLGLVSPHIARRLVGGDLRRLLPVAALTGSLLLVTADVIATTLTVDVSLRDVAMRAVLPVGALTAGIGAPFLLSLLRREIPR